jgi:predicted amidohydrolase
MRDVRVATAQFENADGDKAANLATIRRLATRAVRDQAAEVVCFHECSLTGYTWLQNLSREALFDLAEPIDGPTIAGLRQIAADLGAVIMAGWIEREGDRCFKGYVGVDEAGRVVLHHRKLHPFIHPDIAPGDRFTVGEIRGVKFGCLICYDNNLPENVRITTLMGAEVIVMPHLTGCTPSPMPGRGEVDPALWDNRHRDPARLRKEFLGPKGREWLMRWLPARAWENGIYAVFSNCIGRDGGTIKPGLAMVLDPDGEILVESNALADDVVTATLTPEGFERASGRRYLNARRPELYARLVEPHPEGAAAVTLPGWTRAFDARDPSA